MKGSEEKLTSAGSRSSLEIGRRRDFPLASLGAGVLARNLDIRADEDVVGDFGIAFALASAGDCEGATHFGGGLVRCMGCDMDVEFGVRGVDDLPRYACCR